MEPSDRRRPMEKAVANRFSLCKTHGLAKHTGWPGSSGSLGPFWALFGPFFFRWQWALVGVWRAQFRNMGSRKWAHFLGLGWEDKKHESVKMHKSDTTPSESTNIYVTERVRSWDGSR